jgi:hypothetical protein
MYVQKLGPLLTVLLGIGCDAQLAGGVASATDGIVAPDATQDATTAPPLPDGTTSPAPDGTTPAPPDATSPVPPDATSPQPDATKPPPGSWSLGQVPFAPSSSWNTAIPAGATYTKLAWPASTGYNYYVNWDAYSPAVYDSQPTDPLVQVAIPANWGWPAGNIPVRLAAGVTGATGTDGEILIIDGTTVHNFWQFNRTGTNTATAQAYGRADVVTDSGWGSKSPFLSAGIVATGSSQLAGLLVQAETDAGEIEHALQIALDSALQKPGFTGEAIAGDGSSPSGIAQEGQRLAIPPGISMPSGLSPLGQKVFRAMQKYGVFDIDVAGGTTVLRAQANAYDATTINNLVKDVQLLIPLLQLVQ